MKGTVSVILIVTFLIVFSAPLEARADVLEGALIGAVIGGTIGLIVSLFSKKDEPVKAAESEDKTHKLVYSYSNTSDSGLHGIINEGNKVKVIPLYSFHIEF